jgi:magnesium-transporting ATPase (P-type)
MVTDAYAAKNVTPWHALSSEAVVERLATDTDTGLDAAEAERRLQAYGPNRLPEGKKRGSLKRLLSPFNNILVYVLLAAGFIKLMPNLWIDAAIIFGVVLRNALLGFIQEGKSRRRSGGSATCCLPKREPCAVQRHA